MVLDTTDWNDNLCYLSRHYVCKIPRGFEIPVHVTPTTSVSDEKCGEEWIHFKSNCYFNGKSELKTWHDAGQFCIDKGANLASIHDDEENLFLVTHASRNKGRAWLGLNDLNLDGTFQWSDGQAANYFQWNDGEPNDYQGGEKCVDLIPWTGLWSDLNCNSKRSFICKRPADQTVTQIITTTSAPEGGCYTGFKPFGNKCYYVSDGNLLLWGEAKDQCEQFGSGSRLASIQSRLEQAFLVTQLRGKSNSYWIGLNDINGDNAYDWIDNWPLTYTYWDKYAPRSQYSTKYPCVAMLNLDTSRPGAWNNYQCTMRQEFICVAPKVPSLHIASPIPPTNNGDCTTGYQAFGDYCYKLVSQKQTWFQAQENCLAEKADIISITNYYEQAFAEVLVADSSESVWIGLRFTRDGSIGWTDKNNVSIILLESAIADLSRCGASIANSWVMKDCLLMLRSICKIRKVSSQKCPSNWYGYSPTSKCYRFMYQHKLSWQDARDNCQLHGGDLLKIDSVPERTWIFNQLAHLKNHFKIPSENWWVGLNNRELLTTWEWADGSQIASNAVNWRPGEPNNKGGTERCGEIYINLFNDQDCTDVNRYICSRSRETKETTSETPIPSSTTFRSFRYVCNQEYVTYNGACYYIVIENMKDFLMAQDACRDLKMTLASIHSKAENDHVQEILGDKVRNEVIQTVWIGLKKIQWKAGDAEHAYFLWTDESPVTYMDKIKSDGSAEDLNMQYGYMEFRHHWNLGGGSKKFGYICKGIPDVRQEITTPTTTTSTSLTPSTSVTSTRWPFFPFSNPVTPRLPPFHHASRVDNQVTEDTGLSGGQIAGIIIGILGILVIVTGIVYIIWKNWKPTIKYNTSLGFDNALFHRTSETVSLSE